MQEFFCFGPFFFLTMGFTDEQLIGRDLQSGGGTGKLEFYEDNTYSLIVSDLGVPGMSNNGAYTVNGNTATLTGTNTANTTGTATINGDTLTLSVVGIAWNGEWAKQD